MEKKIKKAVAVTIVTLCAVIMNARLYAQENLFYVGVGGGLTVTEKVNPPAFTLKFGVDVSRFIVELEASAVSLRTEYEDVFNDQHSKSKRSTEVNLGTNLGVKFVDGNRGYLALMLNTGYSLQDYYYSDIYYNPYYDYGYTWRQRYLGRFYIGSGVKGSVNISDTFSLFAEARYQTIPVGKTAVWGGVFQAGMAVHF